MASEHSSSSLTKEQRILRMCRQVLTDIAKDTVTPQGMKHPLSSSTIQGIRDCLQLIASREAEILAEQDRPSTAKPHFIDEPQKNVVVELSPKKPKDNTPDE
ncbi:MAG TPA: segregation and condensation protein A [Gammaproteobacteria bacterium]